MCRLPLLLGALVLLSGCGRPSFSGSASPRAPAKETPQVVKHHLEASWPGATFEIVKEQPCTYKKQPATAVHVKVKTRDANAAQDYILIVVAPGTPDARVKDDAQWDAAQPFDEAVRGICME